MLQAIAPSKPVECLQETKKSSLQTNEVRDNRIVHHHHCSLLATRVASDEEQTILEQRNEFPKVSLMVSELKTPSKFRILMIRCSM